MGWNDVLGREASKFKGIKRFHEALSVSYGLSLILFGDISIMSPSLRP